MGTRDQGEEKIKIKNRINVITVSYCYCQITVTCARGGMDTSKSSLDGNAVQ